MTESPKLQLVGGADGPVCQDGVCDLPETATVPEQTR